MMHRLESIGDREPRKARTFAPPQQQPLTADRVAPAQGMLRKRAVITTATCPLRPLVRVHPELATVDRGMWAALAARALDGINVDQIVCDTPRCDRDDLDCRVLLTLRRRRGSHQPDA